MRSDLWLRVRALFLRNRVETELDEELGFHIEMEARKNLQAGMDADEARRRAEQQFGRPAAVKEECRDERRINLVETLLQDIRYALRGFRRAPIFALTVIATIGLGLGINTAVFTIFNAYVLRPLAVAGPWSLYEPHLLKAGRQVAFTWQQYENLRAQDAAFSEVYASRALQVRMEGRQSFIELTSGNYFRMLGVQAERGRTFTSEDAREAVMVLSYAAWQRSFASDPNIVGRKVLVRGYPLVVIGVARRGFEGLASVPQDGWIPLAMTGHLDEGPDLFGSRGPAILTLVGRLKPGIGTQRAEAALTAWARGMTAESSAGVVLRSRATSVHLDRDAVLVLLPITAAFALILLIACANVANMMLARAMARQREIGIRLSLGAARGRLIRQLLTESVLLAFPGAAAGLLISQLAIKLGLRIVFATLPPEFADLIRITPLDPDFRVFIFMMAAAVACGLIFGLAPATQATRANVVQASRGDFGNEFRPQRMRNALVTLQITVCAMLLICAGVLLRGANQIHNLNNGLRTHDVIWIEPLEKSRARIVSRLAEEPLVRAVASSSWVPLDSGFPSARVSAGGEAVADSSYDYVSPEFFQVLDIPVRRGRNFTEEEARAGAPVALVSEALAKRLWPVGGDVGRSLRLLPDSRSHLAARTPLQYAAVEVIGVVRDVNTGFADDNNSRLLVYFPTNIHAAGNVLLLGVNGDPETARQEIDRNLAGFAPGGVDRIHRMQELVTVKVYPFRMAYWVSAVLGMLALLLTVSGIYGVLSYLVEQRVREIGLRMALGATRGSVIGLVLRQSLRLAATGIGMGVALALAASRVLASALEMIGAFDVRAFGGGVLIVLLACLAAAFVPSMRASRVDPMSTLRHD